ncbi:MAG: hypothetical protein ACOYM7_11190, partial [Paludibacter sp.]
IYLKRKKAKLMNWIKIYFKNWDFTRIFKMVLGILLFIGYLSTKESMYLAGSIFLSFQALLNIGCPGGTCATNVPEKKEKPLMEFEKYEPQKSKENV